MKIKPFNPIPSFWLLLILISSSCQQSSIKEAEAKEVTLPVEEVSQEETLPVNAYTIQEKSLQRVLKRTKGLPDLILEVSYPFIAGEKKEAFIDSLNVDYEKRATKRLQELKATDLDMLDVLVERKASGDSTHYIFELAKVRVNTWKNKVLNIVKEEYVMTHQEPFLGMTKFECHTYSLASGRLLSTEEVFKSEFIQVLKPRAKELLEVNGVNEYWISTDLENLYVDVRYLILKEDGSFAYLYGVPIPQGRAVYEEIEFTSEEAKQLLKI